MQYKGNTTKTNFSCVGLKRNKLPVLGVLCMIHTLFENFVHTFLLCETKTTRPPVIGTVDMDRQAGFEHYSSSDVTSVLTSSFFSEL